MQVTRKIGMKLRAHHLFCIRAFKGLGYSPEFVTNMYQVIDVLKKSKKIEISSELDCICSLCPNNVDNKCLSEEKVVQIDRDVLHFLQLQPDILYTIGDVQHTITQMLTAEDFDRICTTCVWKQMKICTYEDIKKPFG